MSQYSNDKFLQHYLEHKAKQELLDRVDRLVKKDTATQEHLRRLEKAITSLTIDLGDTNKRLSIEIMVNQQRHNEINTLRRQLANLYELQPEVWP